MIRAVRLAGLGLTLALVTAALPGAASAYWSATSVAGGHGAASAGTVVRGSTPVATPDTNEITVDWAATMLSSGSPADGYTIQRYDVGSPTPQPVAGSCAGLVPSTTCTDADVPPGSWTYTVTPRVGSHWGGPESLPSEAVLVAADTGPLGTATTFSVLGGTGVTSTGVTTVSGDLGTSPSTAVVGFPPGIVAGTIHAGDPIAAQAQADLTAAYDDADNRTPDTEFSGDLNGRTFSAGVHHTAAALSLTGTMTLDGENDPDAVFIFQVDAALDTAAGSHIDLVNGADAANVYWQVLGAAGTGASSTFAGTILAMGGITLGDSTTLIGRALSTSLVTMANNTVRFTTATPPTIEIAGGSTAVTKDSTPTIAGTSSAAPGRTVTVAIAGQVLTTVVLSDGTWSVTSAALPAGEHEVVASVRDAAGNAGTATQTLVVEINPDPVDIGTTATFSVLAGVAGVTNTGLTTTVSGDVGVYPGDAVVGLPPGSVAGTIHAGDATAEQAQADLTLAYDEADDRTPHTQIAGDLNGRTFHAGVHHAATAVTLTGTMTLDGENLPDAVFIFQVDAALDTAAASHVNLINGAQASNVYWQVVGAVGTGAGSTFAGTILAKGAITLGDSTQLIGRALSKGGVTLANNTIRFTTVLPPTIAIAGGSTALTKDSTPTIAGTTNAPEGSTVTVTIAAQTLTTTVLADGTWNATSAVLVAGVYAVAASVRDAAGNAGKATQSLTVEVNPDPVDLRTAAPFSLLAGVLGVTNSGLSTTVAGDVGVNPGIVVVGFLPGNIAGTVHAGDSTAEQAQADLTLAYDDADNRTPHSEFSGDLNGRTFRAGVHHTAAALSLTGTLTLDGEHDPDAVFVFQVDAALDTAAASRVVLVNGAQASNVYWQVLGAAGTGADSTFVGTILAIGNITLGNNTLLIGRGLTKGGVVLANTTVRFAP